MAGKVDGMVHPSRLSPGFLFSGFSVFSNAFFLFFSFFQLLLSYLINSVWVGSRESTVGFDMGKHGGGSNFH